MRKNLLNALAIGAGLALGATAVADLVDGLVVVQPFVDGNVEVAGPRTFITVNVPAGQEAANRITDATEIRAFLTRLDDAGVAVAAIEVSAGIVGAPVNYDNVAGNPGLQIDLTNAAGTEAFFNAAVAAGNQIGIVINTTDIPGASNNGVRTLFDAGSELADQTFAPDTTRPFLTNVFITTDGLTAYFVFNEALNNGAGGNDDNHTVLANLDPTGADFQVNTANSFDGTQLSPTGLTVPAFLAGSDNTVLQYTRDPNATTLNNGAFVRPFFSDAGTTPVNEIYDVVANRASNVAVQVAPLTPLQITGVEFLQPVTSFGAVVGAVRVTYNLPLDGGDLGDVAFYGNTIRNADGSATDIDITGVAVDPDNSSAVLLDLFANGTDFIFSDGLSAAGTAYRISTDLGGDVPSSIFDANDYATAQNVTGVDRIAPGLVARSFHDLSGDGKLDAVAFIFDEALASTSSTNGLTLVVNDGVTIRPFALIDPATGGLVAIDTDVAAAPDNEITNFTVQVLTLEANGVPAGRANNALVLSFDPDTFAFDGTAGNGNVPGTGDSGVFNIEYDANAGSLADANGNEAGSVAAGNAMLDLAPPVLAFSFFYTGDNQIDPDNFLYNASNLQFLSEQDGEIGNQDFRNRAALYFSEAVNNNAAGTIDPTTVLYGPDFTAFEGPGAPSNVGGDFIGFDNPGDTGINNGVIFNLRQTNARGLPTNGLQPGVQVTIDSGSNIEDLNGNEVSVDGATLVDRTAPYVAIQADVNNNEFVGAYLVDDNGDNLVDRILLVFTEPIDPATLNAADFTTSRGTVTGVGLDSADGTQRTVAISLSGSVSMNSNVSVTYNAAGNANALVASDATAGGLGNAVDDVTTSIGNVRKLQSPLFDTDAVAIQPIVGTVTINGQPVQQGTKVFASVAVPTVFQVEATHKNVFFQYRRNFEPTYGGAFDEFSLNEWTNWLLGVFPDLYLQRNSTSNVWFSRSTDNSNSPGTPVLNETVRLTINAQNLNNITFQGTGETNQERVQNGRARLAWDLLRSNDGRLSTFFQSGYQAGGQPIVSSAVIDNADGQYSLHVSAPIGAFNGLSRFNAIGWPIIVWVELPDGTRQVASSLLTSVNGAPINFNPANRTQSQGNAPNALSFNIELNNIGVERVFEGWNTVPFGRVGGWAGTQSQVPVRANGIPAPTNSPTSPIQVGSNGNLPAVSPLEQFVWFVDNNNDGVWSRSDDFGTRFGGIVIDSKFVPNFAFTMTSFGVQAGASINNIIGGYGFGFFSNVPSDLGLFQFGAPMNEAAFFTTNPFPNNTTTQGWALLARTQAGAITPAVGNRVDYVIWFNNRGNDGIQVRSLAVQNPSGTNNPNDLGAIPASDIPAALFTHFQP